MTKQTNGNGSYASYTYDSRNRPTVIDHMKSDTVTRIAKEQTTYDNASNVTQKIIAGVTTNYQYDDIDQLTQEAVVSGSTTNYTYDANGNRATKAIVGGITETYTNDDADKLTSVSVGGSTTKSFTYDVNGNTHIVTTSAGATTLDYDYENRLSTITYPSLATNTFSYNGLDTRVGKADSGGTYSYLRDGIEPSDELLSDGVTALTSNLSTHSSTQDRIQHVDRIGSVIRQTNLGQGVTSNITYDAYGNRSSSSGLLVGPFGSVGSEGYSTDVESGLMLLGSRYYDSSTGRFISRDLDHDGENWYRYCNNNPLSWFDDSGYRPKRVGTGKRQGPNRSIKHSSRGKAEDAARQDGAGKPIHHTPDQGPPHFHPADRDGKKIPGPHHEYPPQGGRAPKVPKVPVKMVGGAVIAYAAWEGLKWLIAAAAVPETGGASLIAAAALP